MIEDEAKNLDELKEYIPIDKLVAAIDAAIAAVEPHPNVPGAYVSDRPIKPDYVDPTWWSGYEWGVVVGCYLEREYPGRILEDNRDEQLCPRCEGDNIASWNYRDEYDELHFVMRCFSCDDFVVDEPVDEDAIGDSPEDLFDAYSDVLPKMMKAKMEAGRQKYGDSWVECGPKYMIRRMEEEFYEFRQAVEHDRDDAGAIKELADVVNFGLMFLSHMEADDDEPDFAGPGPEESLEMNPSAEELFSLDEDEDDYSNGRSCPRCGTPVDRNESFDEHLNTRVHPCECIVSIEELREEWSTRVGDSND